MARTASKSKQGSSLAAMAAALDTRKKALPADAKPGGVAALRAEVKGRATKNDASSASLAREVKGRAQPSPEKKAPAALDQKVASQKPAATAVEKKPATAARVVAAMPEKKVPIATKPVTSRPAAEPFLPRAAVGSSKSTAPGGAVMGPSKPGPSARLPERPAVSMTVSRPEPRALPAAAPARPEAMLGRTAALSSLNKAPAAPAKTPTTSRPVLSTDPRRRYPRASLEVRARLSLADDPSRVFEASLPTVNISVGGMFLESSFFLKMGTRLLVELKLPPKGREVHVKADVVRVETNGGGQSGFALRFTEYLDGSEVVLATHFLSPVLREFITAYARKHRFEAGAEYIAHTADVLAAWELKKAELGGDVWSLTSL